MKQVSFVKGGEKHYSLSCSLKYKRSILESSITAFTKECDVVIFMRMAIICINVIALVLLICFFQLQGP